MLSGILVKTRKLSSWLLLVLVVLYIVTGYGMTKQLMDPILARYLHTEVFPIPLFILLGLHTITCIRRILRKFLCHD